jgi:hypothetical protein
VRAARLLGRDEVGGAGEQLVLGREERRGGPLRLLLQAGQAEIDDLDDGGVLLGGGPAAG